jgi:hypothetical protein
MLAALHWQWLVPPFHELPGWSVNKLSLEQFNQAPVALSATTAPSVQGEIGPPQKFGQSAASLFFRHDN